VGERSFKEGGKKECDGKQTSPSLEGKKYKKCTDLREGWSNINQRKM